MDTICLCKAFHKEDDLAPNYKSLLTTNPPMGCKTWLTGIPDSSKICLWVKINCHELLGVQNLDAPDIERLTAAVTDWLGLAGLTVNDLNVNRIDYDYNVVLPENVRGGCHRLAERSSTAVVEDGERLLSWQCLLRV